MFRFIEVRLGCRVVCSWPSSPAVNLLSFWFFFFFFIFFLNGLRVISAWGHLPLNLSVRISLKAKTPSYTLRRQHWRNAVAQTADPFKFGQSSWPPHCDVDSAGVPLSSLQNCHLCPRGKYGLGYSAGCGMSVWSCGSRSGQALPFPPLLWRARRDPCWTRAHPRGSCSTAASPRSPLLSFFFFCDWHILVIVELYTVVSFSEVFVWFTLISYYYYCITLGSADWWGEISNR